MQKRLQKAMLESTRLEENDHHGVLDDKSSDENDYALIMIKCLYFCPPGERVE